MTQPQTLTDPDQRATYDALAGFSAESTNPFYDAAFEKDQAFVDEVSCIGARRIGGALGARRIFLCGFWTCFVLHETAELYNKVPPLTPALHICNNAHTHTNDAGCGKCVRSCDSFVIETSKYGRARVATQPRVRRAAAALPFFCIALAPRLPLRSVSPLRSFDVWLHLI